MSLDDYLLGPVVAVQWSDDLAAQFPHSTHHTCLQSGHYDHDSGEWRPLDPPLCHGWHCPLCGQPTGSMGHKTCTTKHKGE